jgi:RHS repeat-associated protein
MNTENKIDKEKQSENESALVPDEPQEELSGYEKVLYDTVLIPSGITETERDNYTMTSYVNDVNQEYTQVLMEYDVNDEVASVYDYGVQRNSYTNLRSDASQTQYYMYDGQGSVSALTSVRGNSVVTYQYDAYGTAKVSGETYSPYQYNAEPVDTNTGLQYLRARYYNSSIGGFITQDTYAGTLENPLTQNLYTYTGNNPINFIDPSGHNFLKDAWNGVKAVGKAVVDGVKAVGNAIVNGAKAIVDGAKNLYNGAKEKVTNAYNKITNSGNSSSKGGSSSRTSGSSTTSGGYSNTVTTPTDAFNSYLANQMEAPEPVDPVTASLQSRFGADANVTIVSPNRAYVNGKLVTALSSNEHKMCSSSKKIKSDDEKKNSTLESIFFNKKTKDSAFIDWNTFANNLMNKIINLGDKVNKSLDVLQKDLDVLGLGVDSADIINSFIYIARGNYGNAALSAAGSIPVVGVFATGGKAIKSIGKAEDVAKTVGKIEDIAKGIKKGSKLTDEVIEGGAKIDINVKPNVSNEKLKNIIKDLYKGQGGPNTIGNGTTMDAVRNEIITGKPTNGKFHTSKLEDYLKALQKRVRAGDLNEHDLAVTNSLIEDVVKALDGK